MRQGEGVIGDAKEQTMKEEVQRRDAQAIGEGKVLDRCHKRDQFFCAALTGILSSPSNSELLGAVDSHAAFGLVSDADILADAAMTSGREYYDAQMVELKNKLADNVTLANQ